MKNYIKDDVLYINIDNNVKTNISDYNKVSLHNKFFTEEIENYNKVFISICYYNNELKKEIVKTFDFFKSDFLMLKRFKGKTNLYSRLLINVKKEELNTLF